MECHFENYNNGWLAKYNIMHGGNELINSIYLFIYTVCVVIYFFACKLLIAAV
jgi:hypothetical protein